MVADEIRAELLRQQDIPYREFQTKLLPTVEPGRIIGVRTPELRRMAKQMLGRPETAGFLMALPHETFDENQLHAFILSEMRDFGRCLEEVDRFLPFVDNWATCDQLSPKVFRRHRPELMPKISEWIGSDRVFTVRFAVGMLMQHFLDEDFDAAYPETVSRIQSEEYYVNMGIAWYFATALAKRYETILPFLEEGRLKLWVHNRTIQKAVESFRISADRKAYLKSLRIP